MRVACLGDVMLDVLVETGSGLVADDDVPARITVSGGGQAANVACWVVARGGRATVHGPASPTGSGALAREALALRGVDLHAAGDASPGAVVCLVADGTRSMASDVGEATWLDDVAPGPWLEGADWLFVSGYALLRARDPGRLVVLAARARAAGTRVAVDLASASMISAYGAAAFREAWRALEPAAVLATDAEWAAAGGGSAGASGGRAVLVLKHGAEGATFVVDGVADSRAVEPGPVVDVTGAGDALAAGFLVGGVDEAMRCAARCVAARGAQPAAARG